MFQGSVGPGGMIVQPSSPGIFAGPPSYDMLFPNGRSGPEPLQAPAMPPSSLPATAPYPAQDNPAYTPSDSTESANSGTRTISDPPPYSATMYTST